MMLPWMATSPSMALQKPVSHPGKITVNGDGSAKAVSEFIIRPEEHEIQIPGVVRKNIAEEITVKVDLDYKKM